MYIDKSDDIVNKYNNIYHRTTKMKRVHVTSNTYIGFNKESNKEGPKFNVDDHVRISKYKNIFAKVYVRDRSDEFFVIRKVKNTA